MGLLQLLCDVLPAFVAFANYVASDEAAGACRDDLGDALPENFYLGFWAELYTLQAVLESWDWGKEPNERQIHKILDVLESRLLSPSQLVKRGWKINKAESFPRLQSLGRTLRSFVNDESDDEDEKAGLGDESEDELADHDTSEAALQRIQAARFLDILRDTTRINQRKDTNQTRIRLIKHLRNGSLYLTELRFPTSETQASELSISKYPSRHVRKLAGSLYKLLQKHWSCKCPNSGSRKTMSPHERREAQLSLATNRRFELTPSQGAHFEKDNSYTDARFELLLPTRSNCLAWQETEVLVKFPQKGIYSDVEKRPVESNICEVIQRAQGTKLRMMVEDRKLWQLRVQPCLKIDRYRTFSSLEELLQKPKSRNGISIATYNGKEKLILSYILATSLLHLHSSHWLKRAWKNENICFHVESKSGGGPNLARPYLTAECTPGPPDQDAEPLYNFHRYPNILGLGIMLLEIARGKRLVDEIEDFELEDGRYISSKTEGLVALRVFEEWVKDSERSISKTIPLGLKSAIQACLEPVKIPGTNPPPSEDQIRHYIFTYIVAPLGTALSDTYLVQLENLHQEIEFEKQKDDPDLFDSFDKKHTSEQINTANKWFKYMANSHEILEDVKGLLQENTVSSGRVTVAVLDTGFEPPPALMETYQQLNRIKESKTWLTSSEHESDGDKYWRIDKDGHGTQVAELLLRVAPVVDIHIAQVFKTRRDLADPHMASRVHQRIADAIDHAATVWKVDIIILSFGFDSPVMVIRHALQRAVRINDPNDRTRSSTLVFAATRNDGAYKDVAWPARTNEVIGISSTNGDGQHSSFNPPDDSSSSIFYALGEAVEVTCPPHMGHKRNKTRLSGTSFANPIAAGLAANILGYVRMFAASERCKAKDKEVREMLEMLKSKDGMKAVLRHRMSRSNNEGQLSLLPWNWIGKGKWSPNKIFNEVLESLQTK